MPTTPTPIGAAPTVPDRADQSTFPTRMYDAFVYLFGSFRTAVNNIATNVYDNAVEAYNAAVAAATSASNASTSAGNASTSASAAAASAATALAAPGTNATSTTSLTVGLGAQTITIQTGKDIVVGMEIVCAYTTTPTTRVVGTVTSYNSGTGALGFTARAKSGSGTYTAWTISITAPVSIVALDDGPLTINGNFEINQRGATSVADDAYCFDRFYVLTESGNVTISALTDPEAGAPWGVRLTQPDASPKRIGLATIIESKDCRWLRSAAAALAARVKLSTGANIRYAILEHTGTADSVTSDVVSNWASATFTPSNFFIAGVNVLQTGTVAPGAATWGDIENYGAGGAAMNNLIGFVWTESAVAQNVTLDFSRFDLLPGAIQLPRVYRANELPRCQRYYEKSFPMATAPAQNTGLYGPALYANVVANGTGLAMAHFKVTKRTTPGIFTTYNPAAANANWRDQTAGADRTVTVVGTSESTAIITGASMLLGNANYIHWTADSEL